MAKLLKLYLPSTPFETFSTPIDGQIVQFIFVWNERMRCYTVSAFTEAGDTIVQGKALDDSMSVDLMLLNSAFEGVLYLIRNFEEPVDYYATIQTSSDVAKFYGLYYATYSEE